MKEKTLQAIVEKEELTVNLTIHSFPANVLEELALEIVKPFYSGNLKAAIRDLMLKAVAEQAFVASRINKG